MKLHGNAALTLKNRRTLARRIGEEGWPPMVRLRELAGNNLAGIYS